MLSETTCLDTVAKFHITGKNLSLLFIPFLSLQLNSLAQKGWFQQNSGTTYDISQSVFFIDNNLMENSYCNNHINNFTFIITIAHNKLSIL